MKTITKTVILMIVTLFALAACNTNPLMPETPETEVLSFSVSPKSVSNVQSSSYPIWAGQNINAGNLIISNDADNLYITYSLTDGWLLRATHLHIASSLNRIPMNRQGIPIPGQFAYKKTHDPLVSEYTYQFSLADLSLNYGDEIFVAAHAEVVKPNISGGFQSETAWGGIIPGGGPRWWFYAVYTIVPPIDNPNPVFRTETAMLRMNDVPNDFSNRWGRHPWFSYVNLIPNSSPRTFYFYAAQHNRVGEAKIWRDLNSMYVEIELDAPYEMQQTHLNVQTTNYTGSPSFGLFPYTATHSPRVSSYTYQIPWQSAWNNADLKVALHGEVGPF